MKTVMDAVNKLKAKFDNSHPVYGDDQRLILLCTESNSLADKGQLRLGQSGYSKRHYDVICSESEFNTLVQECSYHAGIELFNEYVKADNKLLEKESKRIESNLLWIESNLLWDKSDEYMACTAKNSVTKCWTVGDKYKIKKGRRGDYVTDDIGRVRFKGELTGALFIGQLKSQPIFTKAMQGAGELPCIGMGCTSHKNDTMVYIFQGLTSNGKAILEHVKTGDVYATPMANITAIDTRTDKEKAIDDIDKIITTAYQQATDSYISNSRFKSEARILFDQILKDNVNNIKWVGK